MVAGEELDVDALLRSTTLQADGSWRRGEGAGKSGRRGFAYSGILIKLGSGQDHPFDEQEHIAAEYMEANEQALKALCAFPGVSDSFLGLQFSVEIDSSIVGTCFSISPRLMRIAGEVGIKVTVYLDLDRQDWGTEDPE